MKFDGEGSEQSGWRPGLVFQNNKGNQFSPNIIALPLTTAVKKMGMPTHVFVGVEDGMLKDSVVLAENPQRMSKAKVGRYITTLSDKKMEEVAVASLLASSAISFIDPSHLMEIFEATKKLNR